MKAANIDVRVNELKKDNGQVSGKKGFWEEFESLQQQVSICIGVFTYVAVLFYQYVMTLKVQTV